MYVKLFRGVNNAYKLNICAKCGQRHEALTGKNSNLVNPKIKTVNSHQIMAISLMLHELSPNNGNKPNVRSPPSNLGHRERGR